MLLDANVLVAPTDDAVAAVWIWLRLDRDTPLVVGAVPLLVRRAGLGGDAEHIVTPLAGVRRLVFVELVDPSPALHKPLLVGQLAPLLLRGGRGEGHVALA